MARTTSGWIHPFRLLPTLLLLLGLARPVVAEQLVAIDVLLQPDRTMLAQAEGWNARLREQMPGGFALDAAHVPHITLLQTYVAKADLDAALMAVGRTASKLDVASLRLEAVGLYHVPVGDEGVAGIVIRPTAELLAIQQAIIDTLAPYRRRGGDQTAFVPDASGTPFNPFLFTYVDTFVPKLTGEHFNPHVSTGVAPRAWLEAREAEPFHPFPFGVTGLAVYQLGNFGTAAVKLAAF